MNFVCLLHPAPYPLPFLLTLSSSQQAFPTLTSLGEGACMQKNCMSTPLSVTWAVCMSMVVELFPGAWATDQWPHHWRKGHFCSPATLSCPQLLGKGGTSRAPPDYFSFQRYKDSSLLPFVQLLSFLALDLVFLTPACANVNQHTVLMILWRLLSDC